MATYEVVLVPNAADSEGEVRFTVEADSVKDAAASEESLLEFVRVSEIKEIV